LRGRTDSRRDSPSILLKLNVLIGIEKFVKGVVAFLFDLGLLCFYQSFENRADRRVGSRVSRKIKTLLFHLGFDFSGRHSDIRVKYRPDCIRDSEVGDVIRLRRPKSREWSKMTDCFFDAFNFVGYVPQLYFKLCARLLKFSKLAAKAEIDVLVIGGCHSSGV